MLDRTIPFYNTILKCENYAPVNVILPQGYSLRFYHPGDEKAWADLHCETGDFTTPAEAEAYFLETYCQSGSDIKSRCVFAVNPKGDIVGSCIAWHDKRGPKTVASLHWLVVTEKEQGKKLGTALCHRVMRIFTDRGELPVYVHTQPWSYAAILLYIHLGFKIQRTDTFSHYENQYAASMTTLKQLLTEEQYNRLLENSTD